MRGDRRQDPTRWCRCSTGRRRTSRSAAPRCGTGGGCWRSPRTWSARSSTRSCRATRTGRCASEHAFYASMEELIPDFERYGIGAQPRGAPVRLLRDQRRRRADHPRAQQAVGELRVLRPARLPPLRRGGRRAADDGVRRAASCSTCTSPTATTTGRTSATATSSTRPASTPGSTSTTRSATARWTGTSSSRTLRDVNFDGIATVCVFGWEEEADDIHRRMLERVTSELRV